MIINETVDYVLRYPSTRSMSVILLMQVASTSTSQLQLPFPLGLRVEIHQFPDEV